MADEPNPHPWQKLRFVCVFSAPQQTLTTEATVTLEAIETLLFEQGALAVTLLDAKDHPLTEPKPGELPLWPEVVVEALFSAPSDLSGVIDQLIEQDLITTDTPVATQSMEDQVWTRAWMDDFKPMAFGQQLWICPSHITLDPGWPVVVTLDPGLAFGSGTHPTTALCLEWLDQWASHHPQALHTTRLLDFGCGSGILAVAAAKLGVPSIVAVDHDPQALVATQDNAKANGVADAIEVLDPETFFAMSETGHFEVVLANILAQPLIELAPPLMAALAPSGQLVLSGLLEDQAQAVKAAYQMLDPAPQAATEGPWVRLAFAHKARYHYN